MQSVLSILCLTALLGLAVEGVWHRFQALEAEARVKAAEKAGRIERYFSLLHTGRQFMRDRDPGWSQEAHAVLDKACGLADVPRDDVEMRGETARLLAGTDLHSPLVLARYFRAGSVAVSPDGRYVALGRFKAGLFAKCSVRLLPLPGQHARAFELDAPPGLVRGDDGLPVQDGVRSLAFSADGKHLFGGMRSGWVYRWNLERPAEPPVYWRAHPLCVSQIFTHPSRPLVYTCSSDDRSLRLWDLSGSLEMKFAAEIRATHHLNGVAVAADASFVACSMDGRVERLDPATLKPASAPIPRAAGLVALSPTSTSLAVEEGERIRIFDRVAGEQLRRLSPPAGWSPHAVGMDDLAFSPDGSLLVTACHSPMDRTVKLWDPFTCRLLLTLVVPGEGPLRPTFTPDGRGLVVACDGAVRFYQVAGRDVLRCRAVQSFSISAAALCPGGKRLATLAERSGGPGVVGEVSLWQVRGGRLARCPITEPADRSASPSLTFCPADGLLAWCGSGAAFHLWHPDLNLDLSQPLANPQAVAFGPEGHRLWTVHGGIHVRGWARRASEPGSLEWLLPAGAFRNFSPKSLAAVRSIWPGKEWVLCGARDGVVRVLRASDGKLEKTWSGPGGAIAAVAMTPDSRFALIGTQSHHAELRSVPDGEVVARLPGHRDVIEAVAANRDLLVTGSRDHGVRLWRRDGAKVTPLMTLEMSGPVRWVSLSEDGTTLAVLLRKEACVRVWDLAALRREYARLGIDW
jgi:WD40 repeat protein